MEGTGIRVTVWAIIIGVASGAATYQDETRLFTNLTTGYIECVRPSVPTVVNVSYTLRTVESLDIAKQIFKTTGWLTLTWYDLRLTWTPADFGGISALEVDFIWRPKFVISNQVDEVVWHGTGRTIFRIFNDGLVRWSVPLVVETSCDVDIANFPFDSQTCALEMDFWTVSTADIDSVLVLSEVDTRNYTENGEWTFDSSMATYETKYKCCPAESMPMYRFAMTFIRKQQYYVINLLVPTLLMSVVVIWTFVLPTNSGERLGYSLTVLLAYTVILTLTAGMLPTTSKQTPMIATYLLVVLILCTTSVAITVINVKVYYNAGTPPLWVRQLFARLESLVFCRCGNRLSEVHDETVVMAAIVDNTTDEKKAPEPPKFAWNPDVTWRNVSEISDRFFLYMYSIAIVLLNVLFIAMLMLGGNKQM